MVRWAHEESAHQTGSKWIHLFLHSPPVCLLHRETDRQQNVWRVIIGLLYAKHVTWPTNNIVKMQTDLLISCCGCGQFLNGLCQLNVKVLDATLQMTFFFHPRRTSIGRQLICLVAVPLRRYMDLDTQTDMHIMHTHKSIWGCCLTHRKSIYPVKTWDLTYKIYYDSSWDKSIKRQTSLAI